MVDFIYHSVCNGTCNAIGRSYNPILPVKWINLIHETVRPGGLGTGLSRRNAGVAQWLERHVANVNVVGSNPITRFLPPLEQTCSRGLPPVEGCGHADVSAEYLPWLLRAEPSSPSERVGARGSAECGVQPAVLHAQVHAGDFLAS